MKKILFIAPHLSTGGLPEYLAKKVELLKDSLEVYVIEYEDITGGVLVVQKNKIKEILGDRLISLPWNGDKNVILQKIEEIQPDVIHLEEIPEYFMLSSVASQIYNKDRKYKIFETCHDSSFNPEYKKYFPDKFILVSNYQIKMMSPLGIDSEVVEYPIDYKERPNREEALRKLGLDPEYKHVLHVGLFTPRKNQEEFFEYARSLQNQKIIFHSVGNTADNFRFYWEPLLNNKPSNVIVHGEKSNVSDYYSAMDLFLFTSRGTVNDKETMPIVIREAISWQIPLLIYNLPVYEDYFDKFHNVKYLNFDNFSENRKRILDVLNIQPNETINSEKQIAVISTYPNTTHITELTKKSIQAIKAQGLKVILASHYPIPVELQKEVDYVCFDSNNVLTYHDYYSQFFMSDERYDVFINLKGEENHIYHGPAVYTNYYNGISMAKSLGYQDVLCFNYDMELTDSNVPIQLFSYLNEHKAVYSHINAQEGEVMRTVLFATDVDFFLESFPLIKTDFEYNEWKRRIGSETNGLENMFFHNLKNNINVIKTLTDEEFNGQLLKNCRVDMCSMVEYFTILPTPTTKNMISVWYSSSNQIDSRSMRIEVIKNGIQVNDFNFNVYTSMVWYNPYLFEYGDKFEFRLYQNNELKKSIIFDDEYLQNKLLNNGYLNIK